MVLPPPLQKRTVDIVEKMSILASRECGLHSVDRLVNNVNCDLYLPEMGGVDPITKSQSNSSVSYGWLKTGDLVLFPKWVIINLDGIWTFLYNRYMVIHVG